MAICIRNCHCSPQGPRSLGDINRGMSLSETLREWSQGCPFHSGLRRSRMSDGMSGAAQGIASLGFSALPPKPPSSSLLLSVPCHPGAQSQCTWCRLGPGPSLPRSLSPPSPWGRPRPTTGASPAGRETVPAPAAPHQGHQRRDVARTAHKGEEEPDEWAAPRIVWLLFVVFCYIYIYLYLLVKNC